MRACIARVEVTIIAGLDAILHQTVTATRLAAGAGTRIGVHPIPVVAFLARMEDAIAATCGETSIGAGVRLHPIAVVAFLVARTTRPNTQTLNTITTNR